MTLIRNRTGWGWEPPRTSPTRLEPRGPDSWAQAGSGAASPTSGPGPGAREPALGRRGQPFLFQGEANREAEQCVVCALSVSADGGAPFQSCRGACSISASWDPAC